MRSKYALYLYLELAKHWFKDSVSELYLTTDKLRHVLKVPDGKLERPSNLTKRALEPAVQAVREHSRFNVRCDLRRLGRTGRLLGVTLTWTRKPHATEQPPQSAQIGTTSDTATAPAPPRMPPFPDTGSIRYNAAWYDLARQFCPEPLPDMLRLADGFRSMLRREGVALDSYKVRAMFERFCSRFR